MQTLRPVGRGASSRKYDLLTALGAYALAQGKSTQRLTLRFMTLLTARYNWAGDSLAVGQREMAQLWACDPRTVKRETAKLRAMGWLEVKRQGVRGRVTEYRLGLNAILQSTEPQWSAVGPDYDLRMRGDGEAPTTSDVVPLPLKGSAVPAPDLSAGTEWALAQGLLHQEDADCFATWLRALERVDRQGGRVTLRAPSRFHGAYVQTHLSARLLSALQSVDEDVREVRVTL